jgi:bacterioferritin
MNNHNFYSERNNYLDIKFLGALWQHVQWEGVKGYATKYAFESTAKQEMKHAEMIAERLYYLSDGKVVPTTKPDPINVGKNLREMVTQDMQDEKKAIEMYKTIIANARKEADEATALLFMEILKDEEEHHDTFETLFAQL